MTEPLTDTAPQNPMLAWGTIPDFSALEPSQVLPAMRMTLDLTTASFEALEQVCETLPIAEVVGRLEELEDRLGWTWGLVNHLNSVRTNDALRNAISEIQPEVVMLSSRLGQSEPLYRSYLRAQQGKLATTPGSPLARAVALGLRAMKHGGVGLSGESKDRFNANQQALAELSLSYGNALLDATRAWHLDLFDEADVAGFPLSLRALTAQSARNAASADASLERLAAATPEAGPWRLTLDAPCVIAFLEHAERSDLRERLYRAWVGRAGPEGAPEFDNSARIVGILRLRREQAQILGFEDYAAYSLDAKMAPSVAAVEALLASLYARSKPAAVRELDELTRFAAEHGASTPLALWDASYWARRLREARYAYSDEDLKPYFPLPAVLDGLFSLVSNLFGIDIRAREDVAGWHPDVRYFDVFGEGGEVIAGFFLDPYSRPADKRGGAWMNELRGRSARLAGPDGKPRTPIAYLVCNQNPPVDGTPSLMTWNEVSTLFHELGHGLQHMLPEVDLLPVAGINGVEWDAVELPSQFMENFLRHARFLKSFARHYQTGESIPDALVQRVLSATTFRAGSAFLRQLYFARLDLALHHRYDPTAPGAPSIWEVQAGIAAENTVIRPLSDDRFLCSFGHLFSGGYAAGYYSYKWAEVLSADAFAAFEEVGLDDDEAQARVGRRFRSTVLALGGSVPPMEVFERFRGRAPDTEALLRHNGLAA